VMKGGRIRTDWGALSLAHDGSAVVCLQSNDTARCVVFGSLERLKQAIDSRKISVKKWAVAVPRNSCILKPLTLPATDLAEAAKMVQFELPSLVPLPLEDIVYGCTVLRRQDNMLNVLVCILKVNTLNDLLEPYRAVGIEPFRVVLEPLAILNWFSGMDKAPAGPSISVVGNNHRGVVLTSVDNCLQKASEITSAGTNATTLVDEILREVSDQRGELSPLARSNAATLLAGTEEYVSEINKRFRSAASDSAGNAEAVLLADPKVTCFENQQQDSDDHSFSYEAVVATGLFDLVKNSKLPLFNLLPQEYLRRFQQKALFFNYLFVGSTFLVLILLLWLSLCVMNWRIERKSRAIEARMAPIKGIASVVDKKRQRVRAIYGQLSNRGLITQIFEELYKYTPKNISISALTFSPSKGGASVMIEGQAGSLSDAFEYGEAMREASLLSEMQLLKAQVSPRPGGSVAEFRTQCLIRID